MRQRDLEILLERAVPAFPSPRADLEQYRTPAPLAADWLYRAYALGDVGGRRVVDLGCGTGMLSVGAALLGASDVLGVDLDEGALALAAQASRKAGVDVRFERADLAAGPPAGAFDTAFTNPPFGAQRPGADRPFLEAALSVAGVAYVLVNAPSRAFAEAFAGQRGARLTHAWDYAFPVPHQFVFHTKARRDVPVVLLRLIQSDLNK